MNGTCMSQHLAVPQVAELLAGVSQTLASLYRKLAQRRELADYRSTSL